MSWDASLPHTPIRTASISRTGPRYSPSCAGSTPPGRPFGPRGSRSDTTTMRSSSSRSRGNDDTRIPILPHGSAPPCRRAGHLLGSRGGGDCVEWCRRLAGRIPFIHLKDYMMTLEKKPIWCEIGRGTLPFARIIAEAEKSGCEWFIVEQDTCPGDPFESLRLRLRARQEPPCRLILT